MTIASELVNNAYREGNIVGATTTLTTEQQAEGLTALNGFLDSLYGYELGEFFFDWPLIPRNTAPVQARWPIFPRDTALQANQYPYPPPNVRILINITAPLTAYFPQAPSDGARMLFVNLASDEQTLTVQGNGRTIDGSFTVADLPSVWAGRKYLYRADLADWRSFTALAAGDTPNLPDVYDSLLELGVLTRIGARFGRSITDDQGARLQRMLARLKAQYRQETPAVVDGDGAFQRSLSDPSRGRVLGGDSLL